MNYRYALPALTLALSACEGQNSRTYIPDTPGRTAGASVVQTSRINTAELGQRIWKNECAGSIEGLVSWNTGEAFPSLGIGHFIWYPAGYSGAFDESFPKFVRYAQSRGVQVPGYFLGAAPWRDKAAFSADKSGRADAMRQWLAAHVALQTEFIVLRSRAALPRMMQASSNPVAIQKHYQALSTTTQGLYCLVDYVNFKGEGLKTTERYKGQGWGLLQVLEEMQGNPQGAAATAEFSRAACSVMRRRVANAPAAKKAQEQKWLPGWINRCRTYR